MLQTCRLLLLVTGAATLLAGCSFGSLMIDERKSPYDFDETVAILKTNAQEKGWVVANIYDFQKALIKQDQADPGRLTVIKICSPKHAARMFANDNSKYVSVMAPCSIAVYQKSDGQTYVSTMDMKLMSSFFGGEVGTTLRNIADDEEEVTLFLKHD